VRSPDDERLGGRHPASNRAIRFRIGAGGQGGGMSVSRSGHDRDEVERLRAMLDGAQEAVWLVSPAGRVLDANRAATMLTGPEPPPRLPPRSPSPASG
jgi:PAS domain-containing protein